MSVFFKALWSITVVALIDVFLNSLGPWVLSCMNYVLLTMPTKDRYIRTYIHIRIIITLYIEYDGGHVQDC